MTKFAFPMPDGSTLGGPYSAAELHTFFHYLVGQKTGIFPNDGGEIAASVAGSTIVVSTGSASIEGIPIYVTEGEILRPSAIPKVGDTGMVAVLAIEWDVPTAGATDVRLEIKESADGTATIPSTANTYGTLIEFPLLSFVMDTEGVITGDTDLRTFIELLDVDNPDHGALKAFGRITRGVSAIGPFESFNISTAVDVSASPPTQLMDITFGTSDIEHVMLLGAYPGVVDSWQSATTVRIKTYISNDYGLLILGFGAIPEEETA